MLRGVGWLVACREDARLPVDVAARLLPGASINPSLQSLARLLVIRSVRCRRLQRAYQTQARAMLRLQRERLTDDFRPALWLGALYLLEGRPAEGWRALEAAERLAGEESDGAAALACVALLMGEARAPSSHRGRHCDAIARDPMVRALADAAAAADRPEALRVETTVPVRASGLDDAPPCLHVQAVAGSPVTVDGPGGTRRLAPMEGELWLAFLSLACGADHAAVPSGEGRGAGEAGHDGPECEGLERHAWTSALWPTTPGAVGRMEGLFSAAIRSLREQLASVARRPVLEASRRGGYYLAQGVRVRVTLDVPSLVANWLLPRVLAVDGARLPGSPAS